MVLFRINLIRESTPPPETRRAIFMAMMGYLALCGLVMTATAYTATKTLMAVRGKRAETTRLEKSFRDSHPGMVDIVAYEKSLQNELAAAVEALEAVNAICEKRLDLPRVLLAITAPLPADVQVVNAELDAKTGALEFDLTFPVSEEGRTIDTSHLIAIWNADPVIVSQLRRISSGRSQRLKVDGRATDTCRFTSAPQREGS